MISIRAEYYGKCNNYECALAYMKKKLYLCKDFWKCAC